MSPFETKSNMSQKKKSSRFFPLLFVVCLALAVVFCILAVLQTSQLQQTQKALSSTQGEVSRTNSDLQLITKKYNDASSRLLVKQSFSVTSSTSTQKIAYLTFDDGPSKYTPQLLQALKQAGVKATFFVIGTNCQEYPDAVKNEQADGNVVGIHSWTHKYPYIYANLGNFKQDFNQLRDYLTQQLGTAPTICRFPGGTNNTVSKKYTSTPIMQEAVTWVESLGVRPIDWDADAGDAETPIPTKDQIVQRIAKEIGSKNNPVILMHDFGNRTTTIDAIPAIVQDLKARGYSFGTLSASSTVTLFKPVVKAAS